jgi:hypothetical protein
MGPYHSFGSMKFIPEIDSATFLKILKANPIAEEDSEKGRLYNKVV